MTTFAQPESPTLPDMSGLAPLHPTLPHAVIYTQPVCPSCNQVKARMFKLGLPLVAVDITDNTAATEQFVDRLAITRTPVTVVHNVFDRPVFFWSVTGLAVDQTKYAARAAAQRLAHLEAAGAFEPGSGADQYLEDLAHTAQDNQAATGAPAPSLTPEQYISLAGEHLAPIRLQPARIELAAHHQLVADKTRIPPVLMD